MSIPTHSSFLTSSQSFCLKYPPFPLIPKLCLPLAIDSEAFISWLFCTGNTKWFFSNGLGTIRPYVANLSVQEDAKPKFINLNTVVWD